MASIYDSNSAAKLLEERQASTNKNLLGLMNQNNSGRTQGEKAASSLGSLLAVLAGQALGGASDTSLVADAQASGEALAAAQAAGVGSTYKEGFTPEGSSYSPEALEQLRKNDQDSLGLLGSRLRDAVTQDRANKQLGVSMRELSQLPPSEESYNKMAQLLSSAGHTEQAMAAYSKGAMLAEERKIAGVKQARQQERNRQVMVAQILASGNGLYTVPEAEAQVDQILGINPAAASATSPAPAPADTDTTTPAGTPIGTPNATSFPLKNPPPVTGESIGVDEPWYNKLSDIDFGLPKDVWDGIVENTKLNARKQNK